MYEVAADWLTRSADRLMPDALRDWGQAMRCEAGYTNDDASSLSFAWTYLLITARVAGRYYLVDPAISVFPAFLTKRTAWALVIPIVLAGVFRMFDPSDFNDTFTTITVVFATLKIVPIMILALSKTETTAILGDPSRTALYFTSKISGILAVAFALAAAASAGKTSETYALTGLLIIATALTVWTIYARFTGRFFGLAQIGRPV